MIDFTKIKSLAEIPDGTRFNNEIPGRYFMWRDGKVSVVVGEKVFFDVPHNDIWPLPQLQNANMFACDSAGNHIEQEPESLEGRKFRDDIHNNNYVVHNGIPWLIQGDGQKIPSGTFRHDLDSFRAAIASGKLVEIAEEKKEPRPSPDPDDVCVCGHKRLSHLGDTKVCALTYCQCNQFVKSSPQASESATLDKLATDLSSATDQHVQENLRDRLLVAAMPAISKMCLDMNDGRTPHDLAIASIELIDAIMTELANREKGAK